MSTILCFDGENYSLRLEDQKKIKFDPVIQDLASILDAEGLPEINGIEFDPGELDLTSSLIKIAQSVLYVGSTVNLDSVSLHVHPNSIGLKDGEVPIFLESSTENIIGRSGVTNFAAILLKDSDRDISNVMSGVNQNATYTNILEYVLAKTLLERIGNEKESYSSLVDRCNSTIHRENDLIEIKVSDGSFLKEGPLRSELRKLLEVDSNKMMYDEVEKFMIIETDNLASKWLPQYLLRSFNKEVNTNNV